MALFALPKIEGDDDDDEDEEGGEIDDLGSEEEDEEIDDDEHDSKLPVSTQATMAAGDQDSTLGTDQRQFRCTITSADGVPCGASFSRERDFSHHLSSVHSLCYAQHYQCWCGKKDVRKDNHKRHLRHCSKRRHESTPFLCSCGHACAKKAEHLSHIKDCFAPYGLGRIGRPRLYP